MIANWGGGGLGAPRSGGQAQDATDQAQVEPLTSLRPALLINDDLLRPADGSGLITTAGGYLQQPWAILDLEIAGEVPVRDRDLLVIGDVARLDGRLVVRLTDEGRLPPGRYAILVAAAIEGTFSEIEIIDPLDRGASACINEQSVVLLLPTTGEAEGPTAAASDLLRALAALGGDDVDWDLDKDGVVTEFDLIDLLGGDCR